MPLNLWKPEPKRAGIVRRLPPVVPGVPITKYTNYELSVRVARRAGTPKLDPGIAWARLMRESNRPEKDAAREEVLRLLTPEAFPRLRILTFPASEWRFERALLAMREGADLNGRGPRRTYIHSVERDEAVFRAAAHSIPRPLAVRRGNRNSKHTRGLKTVTQYPPPPFASALVRTAHVAGFLRCTFEDYAGAEVGCRVFDAAWLDFNGHLPPSRLDAIATFWNRRIGSLLVVTLLNGRTSGNVETLLSLRLPGSRIESANYYSDGAPMVQIVLRRVAGMPTQTALADVESPQPVRPTGEQIDG